MATVEPLETFPAPTLEQIHDAFIAETRGEGGTFTQDGTELVLETVQGVQVVVCFDTWTYYGPIWNARLEIPAQSFTVPLLEGPHLDEHQPTADAIAEAVAWMRKITDAQPDRDF